MASPPELLRRVPLIEGLGPEDLHWIAKAAHVRSFAAGGSVFEIGEPGRSLYILTAGNVQSERSARRHALHHHAQRALMAGSPA